MGRWVGALGRGEAPHGSPWRRPCDEQEEVLRVKRGGGFLPARPDWWPPTIRPRATPRGLIAASVTCLSRQDCVPPSLRTFPPLGGTLEVHRTSWRIPFPRHACMFLVMGFRGAWVSHAPPRVPKQRRPQNAALPPVSGSCLADHLHGTGCLSARPMDTGFPTVVWCLCVGPGCVWARFLAAPRHSWLG